MFLTKNISSSFYAVLAAYFIVLDSCSNLSTLPHVILHEGLARSCRIHISKSEGKPTPWGEGALKCRWGVGERSLPRPSPIVCDSPPSPERRGLFLDDGFCDIVFGFAQNDRVGGILRRVKVFGLEKPTERKSVAMSIDFWMMLCALVLDWWVCVLVWIDAMSIGFWLIHLFDNVQR